MVYLFITICYTEVVIAVCHAELDSASHSQNVVRSRIEFGMTLWLILIEQPFFIDFPQLKLQQMCSDFFGTHAC